ncbi:MAG TPA: hypothetical protein P5524_02290 [Candidatus Paceibacterota bacterium]|nr:hypothetical protein [Candidatus Paceibacterota bacterium]
MSIVGQKRFGPGDFSVGLVHEALAILSKFGFAPEMLKRIADLKSGMAEKVVNLFQPEFVIFKTITLGVYQSVSAYREALEKAGFRIGAWASDVLNGIQVSQSQVQLDLVALSVADLGFKEAVQPDQIYARAKELGLELCPPEVGPALRLAYPDQPQGEWLGIAMELIFDRHDDPGVFNVGYDGDRWLSGDYGHCAFLWLFGCRFVFVLPRKQ